MFIILGPKRHKGTTKDHPTAAAQPHTAPLAPAATPASRHEAAGKQAPETKDS
jgi:hypothetical protein